LSEYGWSLDTLFRGRPACRALYQPIEEYLTTLGPVEVRVTKTQVAFAARTQFAWVWLPPRVTLIRPADSIVLSFVGAQRIEDPRIVESLEPYPGRWMHHVLISEDADFDAVVKGWLAAACAFGQIDRRRRRASR
jgi:hypothetical protein